MSLKYDENKDSEFLDSDLFQAIDELNKKVEFAVTAFTDILFWGSSLEHAQQISKWAIEKLKEQ